MNKAHFKKLFEPTRIGQMELKNRIVMPPMGTGYGDVNGYVTQRQIDYYEARARGGAGLIITEVVTPSMQCRGSKLRLTIHDDSYIPGFRKLVESIHKHGAKVALQLNHPGRLTSMLEYKPVGPSPIRTFQGDIPHELSTDELKEIVGWFAAAAGRGKEAGFDGIEVHAAHDYLLASFLSSATNVRTDKYGGTLENKARFCVEILRAIKKVVGPNCPVWIRINGREYGVENGITIDETKQVVPMLVGAGAQAIHVSGYGMGSDVMKAPVTDSPGYLVPLAEEVKKVATVPVITVGRMDADIGEKVLEEGKADLIAIGRRLMADPDLPNKVAQGRQHEINPCIGCFECLERLRFAGQGATCVVNAVMGREIEYQIRPANKAKRVIIIGGGPAGMEAARVAALSGHRVVLYEREQRLGGQLNIAALPPHKSEILPLIAHMSSQIKKAGVEIRLGTEATVERILESNPDTVVVATGSVPKLPEISGINRPNVVTAREVLSGQAEVKQNAVIIGGGMVGCETAYFLAEKGKKVTIIEVLEKMASDMFPMVRRRLMDGLRKKQVTMLTKTNCEEITESGVTAVTGDGHKEVIPADSIVLAVGYNANKDLYKALEGKVSQIHCIGDSSEPRRIMDAIREGYNIGLNL